MKMGILGVLGVVFVTLKLCGVIAWSWWWVLSPFIASAALAIVALGILSVHAVMAEDVQLRYRSRSRRPGS